MRLAGYAAIFDCPDSGGDIVRRGAFARAAKGGVPLLRQHDPARRIGFVERLEEDERGLRVIATLDGGEAVAEGAGLSFGDRGFAYAVFEDLQLATFGNRIPQLTFEIFEREGPVKLLDIAAGIAHISGNSGMEMSGYAVVGDSGRSALVPLIEAMPVLLRADGQSLELLDWPNDDDAFSISVLGYQASRAFPPSQTLLRPANDVPTALSLRHYDPARDYQLGVQRSHRGGTGRAEKQIDLPASLAADAAKGLVDAHLLHAERAREGWTGDVAIGSHRLRPGDWLIDPSKRKWRIDTIEHGNNMMHIEASGAATKPAETAATSPGRSVNAPDQAIGETRIILADLPASGDDPAKPLVGAFCAGTRPGWRRAALSVRRGDDLLYVGVTARPAIIGKAENVLGGHSPFLVDSGSEVIVELLHQGMVLPAATGSPLDAAAPLFMLGDEYLRYGSAEALGDGRYRLSQLLRGCHGSEAAIATHGENDGFVLIEAGSAKLIEDIAISAGQSLRVEALGIADVSPAVAELIVNGRAISPLPPVHLRADIVPDDIIHLSWTWRSRIDFGWQGGVDQPCPELALMFAIQLNADDEVLAEWQVESTEFDLPSSILSSLGVSGGMSVEIRIFQIGRFARSAPAVLALQIPT